MPLVLVLEQHARGSTRHAKPAVSQTGYYNTTRGDGVATEPCLVIIAVIDQDCPRRGDLRSPSAVIAALIMKWHNGAPGVTLWITLE